MINSQLKILIWLSSFVFTCGLTAISPQAWAITEPMIINSQPSQLPLDYMEDQTQNFRVAINARSELVIEGDNQDSEPRIVILRFDDSGSSSYNTRLNIERVVIPGPFTIQVPLFGQKTPSGRIFDWHTWRRFILFSDNNERSIIAGNISIVDEANYSDASYGFDLGTPNSPVLTGMTQITEAYPGLRGPHLNDRHFASGNAMTSDGIEGIESLTLDIPNGEWDVTLWFSMEGEWENLPRQMNRAISVQGEPALVQSQTANEWLQQHYFMGRYQDAWIDGSPWDLFGDREYQRVTIPTTVSDGILTIGMAGATTHDNYLSGVFVSPSDLQGRDNQLLYQALKTRFEQKWQVVNKPQTPAKQDKKQQVSLEHVYFSDAWQPELANVIRSEPVVSTPGNIAILDFSAQSNQDLTQIEAQISFTDSKGKALKISPQLRQGVWRYQRPEGSSTLLLLSADELQTLGEGSLTTLHHSLTRRFNLAIPIPHNIKTGIVNGQLTLLQGQQTLATSNFKINVLPIKLPKLRQSVGIYHERSPHWNWFHEYLANGDSTLKCDLRFLEQLGLRALSPPLSTPVPINRDSTAEQIADSLKPYISDLNHYHHFFDNNAVDYTTIKRFAQYYHNNPALNQRHLSALAQAINEQQLPMPQFAITDEMEELNPTELSQFSADVGQLQNAMPGASFLGQLNKTANMQLTPILDTMVINHGFGVSKQMINSLQRQGKSVWLYNMTRKRLAAGFYLWQSGAQGYLQWHGRMPTGQPFNPVDGREADFQLLYPSMRDCEAVPDINASLLSISQGIEDRRWLNWLTKYAGVEPKAKQLLNRLRSEVPTKWEEIEQIEDSQIHQWRKAITDLAIEINSK